MCKARFGKQHNIRQMTKLRETSKRNTMHALRPLQNAQLRSKIKIPKKQAKSGMFFAKKKQNKKQLIFKKIRPF